MASQSQTLWLLKKTIPVSNLGVLVGAAGLLRAPALAPDVGFLMVRATGIEPVASTV